GARPGAAAGGATGVPATTARALTGGAPTGAGAGRGADAATGALGDAEIGAQVRRRRVGLDGLTEAEAESLVDQAPTGHVIPVHQGHGDALAARAAGAADPVDIRL